MTSADADGEGRLGKQTRAEERRIAALEADLRAASARLAALRGELAASDPTPQCGDFAESGTSPRAPAAKIAHFRSLFRGRADVFPRR